MAGGMIDESDPARAEIVRRALKLGITGNPSHASHPLGSMTLADGTKVNTHVVHAVDAIITDGRAVVVITRSNEPGKGKAALPGGFIDPKQGDGVENAIQAAVREAMEEVGVALQGGTLVGRRKMERPFDVRVAYNDMPALGIRKGDLFMFSTQGVRFDVPDLAGTQLVAGDDAAPGSARRLRVADLTSTSFGIPDHFEMIKEAMPEQFS